MFEKCEFDINGICRALACYSSEKCGARDKKGNPIYCSNEELKKEIGAEHIELMWGITKARLKESEDNNERT